MATVGSFDKYAAYSRAVQAPREDVRMLRGMYREIVGHEPNVMREDFCGAFALCCEWVKLGIKKEAIGIDLDPEALAYGRSHNLSALPISEQSRIRTLKSNVLSSVVPKAELICALNFSYNIFHTRKVLKAYFENCYRTLLPGGLLIVDNFGGPECQGSSVETRRLPGLTYYWEQENFDPINSRARFHIHFKPKKGRIRKRVFSYDWRLWNITEIRDIMADVGFKRITVYWEGTARNGSGSGHFHAKERGEACQVWISYIVAQR